MMTDLYDGWQQDRDDAAWEEYRYSEEYETERSIKQKVADTLSYIPSFKTATVRVSRERIA